MLRENANNAAFDSRSFIEQVGGYSLYSVAMSHKLCLPRDALRTLCLCQIIHRGITDLALHDFPVAHHRKRKRQALVVVSYHLATRQRHRNPHPFETIMRRPVVSVDQTEMLNARLHHEREGYRSYPNLARVRHDLHDRPGAARGQQLQLTIGARDEFLNHRGGQNSLTVSEVSDIVTHGAEIAGKRRARQDSVVTPGAPGMLVIPPCRAPPTIASSVAVPDGRIMP
jgi:hypothetical protein